MAKQLPDLVCNQCLTEYNNVTNARTRAAIAAAREILNASIKRLLPF